MISEVGRSFDLDDLYSSQSGSELESLYSWVKSSGSSQACPKEPLAGLVLTSSTASLNIVFRDMVFFQVLFRLLLTISRDLKGILKQLSSSSQTKELKHMNKKGEGSVCNWVQGQFLDVKKFGEQFRLQSWMTHPNQSGVFIVLFGRLSKVCLTGGVVSYNSSFTSDELP